MKQMEQSFVFLFLYTKADKENNSHNQNDMLVNQEIFTWPILVSVSANSNHFQAYP
jgi:hypothetical protein